jgi:hypothetical protein
MGVENQGRIFDVCIMCVSGELIELGEESGNEGMGDGEGS